MTLSVSNWVRDSKEYTRTEIPISHRSTQEYRRNLDLKSRVALDQLTDGWA